MVRWVSTRQWSGWLVWAGTGWSSAVGLNPRSTILSMQVSISMYISYKVGCQNSHVMVTEDPSTSNGSSASSGGMPITVVGPLSTDPSPHRAWVISTNLGGGHRGLWLDCSSVFSWEEAAGVSVSSVVMGQSSPWAANWDPLGWVWQVLLWLWLQLQWRSHGAGSASLGELTSTQLEGTMAMKTSTSIKETRGSIACRVWPHFLPDGKVNQELAVGPPLPSTEVPSCRWGSGVTG